MRSPTLRTIALAVTLTASILSAQITAPPIDITWWKHAVVYEIYPRSFQDSNGDGIGDLNGITHALDYLQTLGVDAIWISPMYPSPQVDFGYDVANYDAIDPQYGTLADFDNLIAEARNATSASSSTWSSTTPPTSTRGSSRPPAPAPTPNTTGTSGATASPPHATAKPPTNTKAASPQQLGLPLRRLRLAMGALRPSVLLPQVLQAAARPQLAQPRSRKAMFNAMQFWLDRGVAGFRLDAVPTLFEDPQLRDEPILPGTNAQGDPNHKDIYTNLLPEVHDVLRRMRAMVDKYPGNRVLIGETYLPNTAELEKWYGGPSKNELQLPMDMLVGFHPEGNGPSGPNATLNVDHFRKFISEAEFDLHGSQPLFVFDNHDNIRSWDRFGDGTHNLAIAKQIATMLLTTRSTALMYYGEELGMTTSTPTRREDVKDPIGITGWPKEKGRDGERTPMQWDASNPQAGFSTDPHTWLPIPASYKTTNVQSELADPNSLLNWYKSLITMRRTRDSVRDGGIVMLDTTNPSVLSYVRTAPPGHHNIVIALNMTDKPQHINLDLTVAGIHQTLMRTLLTNEPSLQSATSANLTLPPFATWIGEVHVP